MLLPAISSIVLWLAGTLPIVGPPWFAAFVLTVVAFLARPLIWQWFGTSILGWGAPKFSPDAADCPLNHWP